MTAPRHDVDDELGVLPIVELVGIPAACERAIWHTGLPVIGLILSKYWPSTGATHLPPMKLS